MQVLAKAHETACELEAARLIAAQAITAAHQVDGLIEQAGRAFDDNIEQSVDKALALQSQAARESASDRIFLRKQMMREMERTVAEGLQAAVRSGQAVFRR